MKAKWLALAGVGAVSGVAVAQTNVTVYGVLDVGYVYSWGDPGAGTRGTNKFSGIAGGGVTAGSRLGFRGEEALGNGLKTVFALEYGLDLDKNTGIGTGGLNARQQFVGLSSRLGTVSLGRQYAPGFHAAANNDALEATDMSLQSDFSVYAGNTITPNSPARYSNAIAYASPAMAGLTFKGIYGFGETGSDTSTRPTFPRGNLSDYSTLDRGQYGLGANYARGPINVDLVWQSRHTYVEYTGGPGRLKRGGDQINEWYLGGSWDFKVVKAYASYQRLQNLHHGNSVGPQDNKLWTVGLSAPVGGAGTVGLSYGKLGLKNAHARDGESWGWGTMYQHSLSKRTALYAAYTYIDNDRYSIPAQTQVAADGAMMGVVGESNQTIGLGIRHSF